MNEGPDCYVCNLEVPVGTIARRLPSGSWVHEPACANIWKQRETARARRGIAYAEERAARSDEDLWRNWGGPKPAGAKGPSLMRALRKPLTLETWQWCLVFIVTRALSDLLRWLL